MSLADLVWAMSKVTDSYFPGGLSDAIYLSCYGWLIAAAREQLRTAPAGASTPSGVSTVLIQGMPYLAMLASFLVLVYLESGAPSNPTNSMTIVIFVLTLLVMLRQGVLSKDEALLRERRAVGIVEARYASLIKNASDVIIIVEVDGALRFASPAAERIFGIHPDELVGRNLLDLWRDTSRDRVAVFLAEVAASRGRTVGPFEVVVAVDDGRSTLECVGSNLLEDPAIAGLALNFRDVSERKTLEEQLRQLAFHDPLTLLANRSLFRNRVEHALTLANRSRQLIAVMFLDIDNFKKVNDSLGHAAGDRLLQAAAQRLVKSTRPSDTVARLGGDEFAILLEGISSPGDVEGIAAIITQSFNLPLLLDGTETPMAASIGVAYSQHGDDTEQLLRNADIAMYSAKATGKARFVVFHPRMQEQLRHRLRLEEDMQCRSPRALASPGARTHDARHIHPACGGIGPGRADRPDGAARSLPPGPRLEQEDRCRRRPAGCDQHLRAPPAARGPGRRRAQRARGFGHRTRQSRDRAHREHDHAQHGTESGALSRAQGARRAHRDRRFWHGLFVALVPASLPHRHLEDRPCLRQPPDGAGRRPRPRASRGDAG
jgi:diguanylate cyclase (GGDEF)-like protein/PAS domain S-box-containing protein